MAAAAAAHSPSPSNHLPPRRLTATWTEPRRSEQQPRERCHAQRRRHTAEPTEPQRVRCIRLVLGSLGAASESKRHLGNSILIAATCLSDMVNSCSARLVSLVLLSRPLPTVLRRSLRSGVHSPVDLFNSRAYTAPYMNLEHLRAPSSSFMAIADGPTARCRIGRILVMPWSEHAPLPRRPGPQARPLARTRWSRSGVTSSSRRSSAPAR